MKELKTYACILLVFLFACQRKTVPVASPPATVTPVTASVVVKDTVAKLVQEKLNPIPLRADRFYLDAYNELEQMLSDKAPANFKRAVFTTENAYYNDSLSYADFNKIVATLKKFSEQVSKYRHLNYNYLDSSHIQRFASVFSIMKDTLPVMLSDSQIVYYLPYGYDFDDFEGNNNWSKMFVTKLLDTHSGNCHSLPFLYKIIAEEMNETAHLALAPNHIYIKHFSKKDGWYNTELTSGTFPIDAWLMASGYIHLSAVQNGIYLDTLSLKQSIALCVIDLANGYKRKFGNDSTTFILKCCELALKNFPIYINALILKAETEKSIFENYMKQNNIAYAKETFSNPNAKKLYDEFEGLYGRIYELGYRKMPDAMYAKWLNELNVQKEKYTNQKISTFK
ncbi:MAG: hypothetical protein U0T74_13550 [Chitinophagales bacterium]